MTFFTGQYVLSKYLQQVNKFADLLNEILGI